MSNAILIHGWADKQEFYDPQFDTASNSHWFPWLTKQLMIRDIHTVAPEMPSGYYPEYTVWKQELERFEINENTTLVGHSCGGGFIVRWLTENPSIKVGKVILVAPWLGVRFNNEPFDKTFFDFKIRSDIAAQTDGLWILNSTDDHEAVRQSVEIVREQVENVQYLEFTNKGHFTKASLGTEEFPELLQLIIDAV